MEAQTVLLLLLLGYAAGVTLVLIILGGRQSPPATVVIQEARGSEGAAGCGTFFMVALLMLIGLFVLSQCAV